MAATQEYVEIIRNGDPAAVLVAHAELTGGRRAGRAHGECRQAARVGARTQYCHRVTDRRTVELTGPARRALEHDLPEPVAWAAYNFVTVRLPTNPHRLGGELSGSYEGRRAAHLGTYRVVYRIDEAARTVYVLSIRLRGDVYGVRPLPYCLTRAVYRRVRGQNGSAPRRRVGRCSR